MAVNVLRNESMNQVDQKSVGCKMSFRRAKRYCLERSGHLDIYVSFSELHFLCICLVDPSSRAV